MPADLRGDLLFTEPVGRLIRRARIVKTEGLTQLRNVYPGSEFMLSTDPLFRPVNISTAPDGTIYIADMYHGIIQEVEWTRPGLVPARARSSSTSSTRSSRTAASGACASTALPGVPATPAGPAAQATPEIPAQPALALDRHAAAHAQRDAGAARGAPHPPERLVARHGAAAPGAEAGQVGRAGAPEPRSATSDNLVARFHALWTLEGLGALDVALVREQMKDRNPRMRVQAIRASETLYKAGDKSLPTTTARWRRTATRTSRSRRC